MKRGVFFLNFFSTHFTRSPLDIREVRERVNGVVSYSVGFRVPIYLKRKKNFVPKTGCLIRAIAGVAVRPPTPGARNGPKNRRIVPETDREN